VHPDASHLWFLQGSLINPSMCELCKF